MVQDLSECFSYMADLLQISGEVNKFKLNHYRTVAQELQNGVPIDKLSRMGMSTLPKIKTYLDTGECPWILDVEKLFTKKELVAIKHFRRITGIGPATIRDLLNRKAYTPTEALNSNALTRTQKISVQYSNFNSDEELFSYEECTYHINKVTELLESDVTAVGKYRRQHSMVNEVCILTSLSMKDVLIKLESYIVQVYKWGERRLEAFVLSVDKKKVSREYRKLVIYKSENYIQDLFILTGPKSYTSQFTSHLVPFKKEVKEGILLLHELNIFKLNKKKYIPPQFRDTQFTAQNKCMLDIISRNPVSKLNKPGLPSELYTYTYANNLLLIVQASYVCLMDVNWEIIDYSDFPSKDRDTQYLKIINSLVNVHLTIFLKPGLTLPKKHNTWTVTPYEEDTRPRSFSDFKFI